MMFMVYLKMALRAIFAAKARSFLTMLGVFIGVLSVVTIVSLGEGVKQQINRQINNAGPDLITVRPGQLVERNQEGDIVNVDFLGVFGTGSLTNKDVTAISDTETVGVSVPFGLLNGVPQYEDSSMPQALIIGTTPELTDVFDAEISYGNFFSDAEVTQNIAVIGIDVAAELFNENAPIGKSFTLRGKEIMVRGVMQEFDSNPLSPGFDYNRAVFLPYDYAADLSGGDLQNYQVLAKPNNGSSVDETVLAIQQRLSAEFGGPQDFTVLKASDNLKIADDIFNILTALVASIAGVSLLVGGIGIMNIMLVAVSERTGEIGVRKSLGATGYQILAQFFIEAVVLSAVGGILGILGSLVANYFIRLFTAFEPALDIRIMALAFGVSVLVGSVFGLMPAVKAASKDPIESLRRM